MSAEQVFEYLNAMIDRNASDLYLTVGFPPSLRIEDDLVYLEDEPLTSDTINDMLYSVLTSRQQRDYEAEMELNSALDMGENGRFRINVMRQRQHPALVIRRITSTIPTFEELRLPLILEKLSMEKRGLILFTGMTGSGKSTSLAAMVDYRNERMPGHIITIEDPIEYYHEHKKSIVSQREVGVDTQSFPLALKNALRQRPDVILVGEIRDREVMEQALTSAETGHLCLATIHTNNAYQAIERIVNFFPEEHLSQVRMNLALNLKAIISQRLLPCTEGGLTPAVEVMLNEGLVRELILKGDIGRIKDVMEQNRTIGMCTYDQSLTDLFKQGLITEEAAIKNSDKASDMKVKIQQIKLDLKDSSDSATLHALDTSVISLKD